eukprot:182327-Chlamydomonas_euryale.AAC.7
MAAVNAGAAGGGRSVARADPRPRRPPGSRVHHVCGGGKEKSGPRPWRPSVRSMAHCVLGGGGIHKSCKPHGPVTPPSIHRSSFPQTLDGLAHDR